MQWGCVLGGRVLQFRGALAVLWGVSQFRGGGVLQFKEAPAMQGGLWPCIAGLAVGGGVSNSRGLLSCSAVSQCGVCVCNPRGLWMPPQGSPGRAEGGSQGAAAGRGRAGVAAGAGRRRGEAAPRQGYKGGGGAGAAATAAAAAGGK